MKIVKALAFLVCVFILNPVALSLETELTPVLKATSVNAVPENNTFFYDPDRSLYSNNEVGIRLNWNAQFNADNNLDLHLKNNLRLSNGELFKDYEQSLFRFRSLSHSYRNDFQGDLQYDLYQEIDRLVLHSSIMHFRVHLGRQAISWGLGRFWQPLDIFGAFSAIALDREYKPGIDAMNLEWFPSNFSQLNLVYVFTNQDLSTLNDSTALHYVQQISERLYLTILAASFLENALFGAGLESQAFDAGIRAEAVFFSWEDHWEVSSVAGLDYQFSNEIIATVELFYQSLGTTHQAQLANLSSSLLVTTGLQKHLSETVLGVSLQKNLFPLLDVGYLVLLSATTEPDVSFSSLHQLNFIYSTSNESDLTLSVLVASGDKLKNDEVQSEFGHVPASVTAQFRYYF